MKVYLAGTKGEDTPARGGNTHFFKGSFNMLESFYYIKDWQTKWIISPHCRSFMLDSGAFTFMSKKSVGTTKLNEYVDNYISFIKKYKIDLFFELDIDSIVSYDEVLKIREKIEKNTGKQTIPVWHKSRGIKEFIEICKSHQYVAVGGIVTKEIPRNKYAVFLELIRIAHKHGAKIHGLGICSQSSLFKYPFDSVDCTTWNTWKTQIQVFRFNGRGIDTTDVVSDRRADAMKINANNIAEWIKFANYMEYDYVPR